MFNVYNKGVSKWSFSGNEVTAMKTYSKDLKVYMYGTFNTTGTPVILNSNNQQQNGNSASGLAYKSSINFPVKVPNTIEFKYALSLIGEA